MCLNYKNIKQLVKPSGIYFCMLHNKSLSFMQWCKVSKNLICKVRKSSQIFGGFFRPFVACGAKKNFEFSVKVGIFEKRLKFPFVKSTVYSVKSTVYSEILCLFRIFFCAHTTNDLTRLRHKSHHHTNGTQWWANIDRNFITYPSRRKNIEDILTMVYWEYTFDDTIIMSF